MKFNPAFHHRQSIRLKGYNYSHNGLYFITTCTQNRACLFGSIKNKKMELNHAGNMVNNEWLKLPNRFNNIAIHEFIVMPNHFHGILEITAGATLGVAPAVDAVAPMIPTHSITGNKEFIQPVGKTRNGNIRQEQGNNNISGGKSEATVFGATTKDPVIEASVVGATLVVVPTTIGEIIGAFKSITTVEYIRGVQSNYCPPFNKKLWHWN